MWAATDKNRVRELLELAKERGVAMEFQPALWYHPERAGRVAKLIDMWLDGGGLVSLGSDAHTLAALRTWTERYGEIVERFNRSAEKMWLPPSAGLVNSGSVLRSWTKAPQDPNYPTSADRA